MQERFHGYRILRFYNWTKNIIVANAIMNTTQEVGAYSGFISIALFVLGSIYAAINHRRIRSNCCGKLFSVSIDIENTTPTGTSELRLAAVPQLPAAAQSEHPQSKEPAQSDVTDQVITLDAVSPTGV